MVTIAVTRAKTFGLWIEAEIYARWPAKKPFAERAGVTETTISNWINHGARPYRATCYDIARALDLPANTVLERAGYAIDAPEPIARPDEVHRAATADKALVAQQAAKIDRMMDELAQPRDELLGATRSGADAGGHSA